MNKILSLFVIFIIYFMICLTKIEKIDLNEIKYFNVDIKGAVENEGVYTFKEGDTIIDALDKCIIAKDADLSKINMSEKLYPEMALVIPYISQESLISINTASIDDLIKLPGIKDGLANRILEYRNKNGGFKSLEEIMNVSGIGEKIFEKISSYICL